MAPPIDPIETISAMSLLHTSLQLNVCRKTRFVSFICVLIIHKNFIFPTLGEIYLRSPAPDLLDQCDESPTFCVP